MIAARRSFLLGAGALGLAGPAWSREGLALDGRFVQGGFAMGRTWPRAIVFVDGEALTTASAAGLFTSASIATRPHRPGSRCCPASGARAAT
ncbi:hypothetical protein [Brevundimonas denitrificans]|uniref:hypothetical protein n=1 Tax=Brevundimonas denitrificans TaxID=1443434 RepID=UPI00352C988A